MVLIQVYICQDFTVLAFFIYSEQVLPPDYGEELDIAELSNLLVYHDTICLCYVLFCQTGMFEEKETSSLHPLSSYFYLTQQQPDKKENKIQTVLMTGVRIKTKTI